MSSGTEADLSYPEARKMLPEAKPELVGVETSSFVIHDEDVKTEQVLGPVFNKEIE